MKKLFILALFSTVLSADAFAGRLTLECSSADGKIRINQQGTVLTIDGKQFRPVIGFKGLELPYNDDVTDADVKVVPAGARSILSDLKGKGCRNVDVFTFAQKVKFVPVTKAFSDSFEKGFDAALICEYWNVSPPLGRAAGCN